MKSPSLFKKVIAPFLTFALMFIGAGFISGSIVHLGEGANPWDISVLVTGVILFMIGSYVQEILYNGKSLKEEGTLSFLFFSLFLSLGIGMVSGGTQHFVDTPEYSSYLIPIGLVVGIVAFVFKTNIKLSGAEFIKLLLGTLVFSALLWGALFCGGKTLPADINTDDHHGKTASASAVHAMTVSDDQEFLRGMIPHHQEAVDSSRLMLARVTQPEQKAFLEKIISVQTKEIEKLKQWHQTFFGTPYIHNGSYMHMMPKLENIPSNDEAWHAYLEGMIGHHESAVRMAQQILPVSKREEVKRFAGEVISTQSEEITQMQVWLGGADGHIGH